MPVTVVNATALEHSGGLTILRQFIDAIPPGSGEYIVFVSSRIEIRSSRDTIHIVPVANVKSLGKRFLWDVYGIKRWLKKHRIRPDVSLSLQNTNFLTGYDIPNYIYYHQSIPFFPHTWSIFRKEERTLWFYKTIYPCFVRLLLNRRTGIFVQLEFIKKRFAGYFRVAEERIHVIAPRIELSGYTKSVLKLPANKINLFYPATAHFYKNHAVLADALKRIKKGAFRLYLTCSETEVTIDAGGEEIIYTGVLSREQMVAMYRAADALLFPSYIETYGLPLIEAASAGLPVLAADLPYAREVLKGYEGAVFIPYGDPQAWAIEIQNLIKGKRYALFEPRKKSSWTDLFKIIHS